MGKTFTLLAAGFAGTFLLSQSSYAAEDGAVEVQVGKKECRRLVAHKPSADVAYKPGVDAYGRPVKPADLPGTRIIKAPNKITIALSFDALEAYGISAGSTLMEGTASTGSVSYDINSGQIEYNGNSLSDPEIMALADQCRAAGYK